MLFDNLTEYDVVVMKALNARIRGWSRNNIGSEIIHNTIEHFIDKMNSEALIEFEGLLYWLRNNWDMREIKIIDSEIASKINSSIDYVRNIYETKGDENKCEALKICIIQHLHVLRYLSYSNTHELINYKEDNTNG